MKGYINDYAENYGGKKKVNRRMLPVSPATNRIANPEIEPDFELLPLLHELPVNMWRIEGVTGGYEITIFQASPDGSREKLLGRTGKYLLATLDEIVNEYKREHTYETDTPKELGSSYSERSSEVLP